MHSQLSLTFAMLLAFPTWAQTAGGYAGQQSRDIKALSAQEQEDLLAGRGMGMARAGELNHHPGPAHVLGLRERLGFSPEQVSAVQASFDRMEAEAKSLGPKSSPVNATWMPRSTWASPPRPRWPETPR